jgi:hypothetical protein
MLNWSYHINSIRGPTNKKRKTYAKDVFNKSGITEHLMNKGFI